ncbi:MAG TPA: hypothetical protein VEQ66_03075 [Propionibacteriaceae bacterium]|nr:hypothetical protein [Propionibacteriaceae bacterium]
MTEEQRERELVAERAHLLPEEDAVGSDDPTSQAEAILAESEERTLDPEGARAESSQTLGEDRW